MTPGATEFVLAFADDEHVIGQRHTEWIGLGPFLEEDLAFASIAQDELGHAAGLYSLVTDELDQLAFFRVAGEYRSCWLVEQPGTDWAHALVRHWLYDLAERHRWEAVTGSADPRLAGLAGRALREEEYHRRHAVALVDRLLSGTDESRAHMIDAIDVYLPLAVALFEPVVGEPEALADGLVTTPTPDLIDDWWDEVAETLAQHDLPVARPEVASDLQAARTIRTDHFGAMHASITEVLRIDPTGNW